MPSGLGPREEVEMKSSGCEVPGRRPAPQLLWAGGVPFSACEGLDTLTTQDRPLSPEWAAGQTPGRPPGSPAHGTPPSQPFFADECKFRETLLPNNYNAYESHEHPGLFIALSKNGRAKKGNRVSPTMKVTHFLPRL